MATITTKKKINGWVLGVHFKDGVAVSSSPVSLAAFQKLDGYTVKEPKHTVSLVKPDEGGDDA